MVQESQSLFKIVIFIGAVLFLASVLTQPWIYVGQPLPPNSTWGRMQNQIENFPQFQNPFQGAQTTFGTWVPSGYYRNISAVGNFTIFGNSHGCSYAAPWDCVNDPSGPDSNTSIRFVADPYVHNANMVMNFSGPSGHYLTGVTVELRCTTESGAPVKGYYQLLSYPNLMMQSAMSDVVSICGSSTFDSKFPLTLSISNITWSNCLVGGAVNMNCLATGANHAEFMLAWGLPYTGPINITYMALHMTFSNSNTASCTGDFFSSTACQIGNGIAFFINGIIFVVNGFIFAVQILFWFVVTIGTLVGAIPQIFSMGGMPPVLSGVLGILILGLIFYVMLVLMGKIRGTGNTG